MRKGNRPEQLHLDLECNYLEWLNTVSENFENYEKVSRRFLKSKPVQPRQSGIWQEITKGIQ